MRYERHRICYGILQYICPYMLYAAISQHMNEEKKNTSPIKKHIKS